MSCFSPDQYRLCRDGLLDAFPTRVDLANLLIAVAATPTVAAHPQTPIARGLRNINRLTAEQSDMEKVVYDVLQKIEANHLCRELVETAHEWNPNNPDLEELFRQFHPLPLADPARQDELEQLIRISKDQFLTPVDWAARFGPIEYRVCRIEVGARDAAQREPLATGFLVGADVVLTNHHVINVVLTGQVAPTQFIFAFDRKELPDGTVGAGPSCGLRQPDDQSAWLLAVNSGLDYALLRLDEPIGDRPIITQSTAGTPAPRGWLSLSRSGGAALRAGDPCSFSSTRTACRSS